MAPRKNFDHLDNPLADALIQMGEWWTPLILWSIDEGNVRFEEIQVSLGIARNILTDRLKTLVLHDILEKRQYSNKPKRFEYHLTNKGLELIPIGAAMRAWGQKYPPHRN